MLRKTSFPTRHSRLPNTMLYAVVPSASTSSVCSLFPTEVALIPFSCRYFTCSFMLELNGQATENIGCSWMFWQVAPFAAEFYQFFMTPGKIWYVRLLPNPVGSSAKTSLLSNSLLTTKSCSFSWLLHLETLPMLPRRHNRSICICFSSVELRDNQSLRLCLR